MINVKRIQINRSHLSICLYFCLLIMLSGCKKPDLVPKELFFDSNNLLNVSFKNEGEGEVPADKGILSIYIDGWPIGQYRFSDLPDQSFRDPGGSVDVRTGFRMAGLNRRIAVFVDAYKEIDESNEFQNTLSRTMTPPVMEGPDFIISDLRLGSENTLEIVVKNIGTANSPPDLPVRIRVIVNESVAADLTPTLPSLTVGGSTVITPDPTIVISTNSRVRVLLNTNNLLDELDKTNNVKREIFPSSFALEPYTILLSQPKIKNNIIWQVIGGNKNYSSWNLNQRTNLDNAILVLEKQEPQALSAPPTLLDGNYISAEDAWKIYVAHVAQCLWVEVHGAVSWNLNDFPDDQLAYLLDSRKLMVYLSSTNRYIFHNHLMGNITAWNPRICYEFLWNLKMIKSSQLETIYALTDWMRGHLIHLSSSDNYNEQFGYAGPPPADKVLYPLEGRRHKTAGCWGTSGLYGAVLRSVNIPVERANISLNDGPPHSRPAFPSVDRSMPHGDDVYTQTLTPSGAVIPTPEIFYTFAEMNTKFINPVVDCVGDECNSVSEQASYNSGKDQLQLAYDYMADYLLYKYSYNGADYLDGTLRGPRRGINDEVEEYVKPYFNEDERAIMIDAVENKVKEIGDGDLEAGKAKVISRFDRFYQNK